MQQIDVEEIKKRTDLRVLVQKDLGKPKFSSNKYDAYPCPFHHGTGSELAVYQDYFKTYCGCDASGDVIEWLKLYHHMGFSEACSYITGGNPLAYVGRVKAPPARKAEFQVIEEPPPADWQEKTMWIAQQAELNLWSPIGERALRYLQETRGLHEDTIKKAYLGYIPGRPDEWKNYGGMSVPCGITIPHLADGHLWAVRVRRAAGSIKYQAIKGGSKALYWSDEIIPGDSILITEGEFDCLVAWQCANMIVSPVSLASASNHRINRRWWSKLITAPSLLVRVDDDTAGQKAAEELSKISKAVKVIQVPHQKDINDFYLASPEPRSLAVHRWLESYLVAS